MIIEKAGQRTAAPPILYASTNSNHITVSFKASPLEKQLITTDRMELNQILREKLAQNAHNVEN